MPNANAPFRKQSTVTGMTGANDGFNASQKGAGTSGRPSAVPNATATAVTKLLQSQKPSIQGLNVIVEGTANVGDRDHETFVTQRGGKIIQGSLAGNTNDASTLFENRRMLQSTLLLQKKKEMQTVQALLEKKRVEFAKRMEECREKQEELRAKQKQIRDRVAKFEKFLKENDAKRQRANAKAAAEKKMRESKEIELGVLQKQLQEEQAKSANIQKLIKRHQIYEQYLQSIVDILPPDYLDVNEPHINDIIMRHKTLLETHEDLKRVVECNQDDIEKQQAILTGLVKEKNDLILVYNSKLGTQQKYLDKLKQDCAYLEQRLEERDNTGRERMRILSETKLAIDDLYDRISVRSRVRRSMGGPGGAGVVGAGGNGGNGAVGGLSGVGSNGMATGSAVGGIVSAIGDTGVLSETMGGTAHASNVFKDDKTLSEKLHAIQYRVLDLQDISQFVDADRKRQTQQQPAQPQASLLQQQQSSQGHQLPSSQSQSQITQGQSQQQQSQSSQQQGMSSLQNGGQSLQPAVATA